MISVSTVVTALESSEDNIKVDPCVSEHVFGMLCRAKWSNPQARAKGMKRLVVAQIGSDGVVDTEKFHGRVFALVTRKVVSGSLRNASSKSKDTEDQSNLNAAADKCEKEGTKESCMEAFEVSKDVAKKNGTKYRETALSLGDPNEMDEAATTFAAAHNAAITSIASANNAVAQSIHNACYISSTADKVLEAFTENVVQILIEMGSPGAEMLGEVE